MNRRRRTVFAVVTVESVGVCQVLFYKSGEELQQSLTTNSKWDCAPYLDDPSGLRLAEEIIRRLRMALKDSGEQIDAVAISVPGTIEGESTVLRSTRIGIFEPIDISEVFRDRNMPPCYVLHDTECLALGEARYGALRDAPEIVPGHEEFAFIYAHEGIGATIYIDGRVHRGAGNAGRIGRLVVSPEGPYNRKFMSRGPLELFAARPWVSANIVGELLAEQGKRGETTTGDRTFRAWVTAASQGDWSGLTFDQIARGINNKDPAAVSVMEEASRYLGLAVHAVLTVGHPPAIILGGGMITELPGFYQSVTSHARRFSYHIAWNKTLIRQATLGQDAQFLGAAELLTRLVAAV